MAEVGTAAWWHEWQANETKSFVQNATESFMTNFVHTSDSLILWLGVIAIIALASAELWIGVGGVTLVVAWVWFRRRQTWKLVFRLDRFRERFRELLEKGNSSEEMLTEDKEFLQERADTILYPLAVAEHKRARLGPNDLPHIETLYQEYGFVGLHRHWRLLNEKEHVASCELCAAASRVRRHIEDVFSGIGTTTEPKDALKALRRIIERGNPEVVFRELEEVLSFRLELTRTEAKREFKQTMEGLKKCGFDVSMLYEELSAAKKRMAKERSETEKTFRGELVAAQFLDLAEEYGRHRRYKEWDKVKEEGLAHTLADIKKRYPDIPVE
jgi:uncharacterized membrane-anchored protein YhcB (DUF1043 family)